MPRPKPSGLRAQQPRQAKHRALESVPPPSQPLNALVEAQPLSLSQPSQLSPESQEGANGSGSVDWDLFATVLSKTARDHERRKRLTPRKSQPNSQTTPVRRPHTQDSTPQQQWEDDDLPSANDTQFAPYRESEDFPSPSGSQFGDALPAVDDSQFDETARPRRRAIPLPETIDEDKLEGEDGLPEVDDSQFQETTRPHPRRTPHSTENEEDQLPSRASVQVKEEEGTPRPKDERFSVAEFESYQEDNPADFEEDDPDLRPERGLSDEADDIKEEDDLPSPNDSQFEETTRIRPERSVEDDEDDEDELSSPSDSQSKVVSREEELQDEEDSFPDPTDSQFEQTFAREQPDDELLFDEAESLNEQAEQPRQRQKTSGESAEIAATEAVLSTEAGEGDQQEEGETVMVQTPVEQAPDEQAQAAVERTRVERVEIVAEQLTERVEVVAEQLPERIEVDQAMPLERPESPVEGVVDDPQPGSPEAGAVLTAPAAPQPIPPVPQLVSARVRRDRDDPTEFLPPDEEDLTEAERRGEVRQTPQPRGVLRGPRRPRRSRQTDVQSLETHVTQPEPVVSEEHPLMEIDAYDVELQDARRDALEPDFDPPPDSFHRPPRHATRDAQHGARRDNERLNNSVPDEDINNPATAPLQVPSQRVPEDLYLVDERGRPLRPNEAYVVPPDWAPPRSVIHGQKNGHVYRYSRLNGRHMRWTVPESLLLWRTIQQVPMSVENPIDVVVYFYGEFGVRNQSLAWYNKQHMRSRLVTMCETRVNRKLPIELRARMFLPRSDPRRMEYEKDKVAYQAAEAERLAIKAEESSDEEMMSDGGRTDDRDEDDLGDENEFRGEADFRVEEDFRIEEEDELDDSPPPPQPKRRRVERDPHEREHMERVERERMPIDRAERERDRERVRKPVNRAYVEIPVRRRRQTVSSPAARDEDRSRGSRRDDGTSRRAQRPEKNVLHFYRRKHADFAHLPPFDVPSPPQSATPSEQELEPESEPEPPRRQSAPGRMRRARPRSSRRTAFDDLMEESDEGEAQPEVEQAAERPESEDEIRGFSELPDLESEEDEAPPPRDETPYFEAPEQSDKEASRRRMPAPPRAMPRSSTRSARRVTRSAANPRSSPPHDAPSPSLSRRAKHVVSYKQAEPADDKAGGETDKRRRRADERYSGVEAPEESYEPSSDAEGDGSEDEARPSEELRTADTTRQTRRLTRSSQAPAEDELPARPTRRTRASQAPEEFPTRQTGRRTRSSQAQPEAPTQNARRTRSSQAPQELPARQMGRRTRASHALSEDEVPRQMGRRTRASPAPVKEEEVHQGRSVARRNAGSSRTRQGKARAISVDEEVRLPAEDDAGDILEVEEDDAQETEAQETQTREGVDEMGTQDVGGETGGEIGEKTGEETQDASLVVRRELIKQKVLRGE
ncbi:hypothetical protein CC85DRAFT_292777 [Cutaneotrichosporon oleaginosum]|uniref:Uncharacterized protein n=1 Tax=Cutaneotrichosporon oleaginosum TaxID=879819 RepID=A0A0J0XJG5_9TREE|nr:uncharacterized protein CC85DRAFT_292777 [Cutaneotrichosporon oleaginosum]KLT41237.1 hypothetical protein CC85DRAFT_292777 [Cutaneotrichosporon oleaginosum]TXT05500.1 hypothetical protein COLE_06820 [Cutaneotrichosporon oleaginosum]